MIDDDDDDDCGAVGGNENWQGKPKYSEKKPASLPLFPPQIPNDLTQTRTREAAVGSRRSTAWATARPYNLSYFVDKNCLHEEERNIINHFEWLWSSALESSKMADLHYTDSSLGQNTN
jgi:hypothetical protein